MKCDFNVLEAKATELVDSGRYDDAIRIYFFMADGDPSLDAGYLGKRIAFCYEGMGMLYAAKYWYGRAVEENPRVRLDCVEARDRLEKMVTIDDLLSPKEYLVS
jgi:tetratricopeptide (TPR) repeat protein